jgi:uncharacterized membrane protein
VSRVKSERSDRCSGGAGARTLTITGISIALVSIVMLGSIADG